MLFGKKDHLVGLDIGSRTIKVCEIESTPEGYVLSKYGSLDIDSGLIDEDGIKDHDSVGKAIRRLFKESNVKEPNVAVSVGGYSVIVKKITVQTMSEEQLQETIYHEAEQYIPFDITDINIDFHIIGEGEHNPNQMNVLLVAAKKELVSDYLRILDIAGLNPCIVDVDAFALQNIYETNYEVGDDCIALVDIGAVKTSINVLKGSDSLFMRDISLGCSQVNAKIIDQTNCSPVEAEEIKLSEKEDIISHEDLAEIISSVVTDWTTEIRRALDFFYSTYPDEQIKAIVLSGGGSNIKEFQQLLTSQTSTEVKVINPFKNIDIEGANVDSAYLEQVAPQAAICAGLAIRRVDDK